MRTWLFVYVPDVDDDAAGLSVCVTAPDRFSAEQAAKHCADEYGEGHGWSEVDEVAALCLPDGAEPSRLHPHQALRFVTADPFPVGTRLRDAYGTPCVVEAHRPGGLLLIVTTRGPRCPYPMTVGHLRTLLGAGSWSRVDTDTA
ncbi:hypothetical protein ACTWJ8_39860 (plasmid) [Streptomyces sp. SDT5-1]|uniref:hypothetical protein n=1 Tax=Streptomyces sp. SDT5-1 TaxID=3406418 RepID=UPI003FD06587